MHSLRKGYSVPKLSDKISDKEGITLVIYRKEKKNPHSEFRVNDIEFAHFCLYFTFSKLSAGLSHSCREQRIHGF